MLGAVLDVLGYQLIGKTWFVQVSVSRRVAEADVVEEWQFAVDVGWNATEMASSIRRREGKGIAQRDGVVEGLSRVEGCECFFADLMAD